MTKLQSQPFNLSNFTPIWTCIENDNLCFNVKNCIKIDLKYLIDLASRMEFPKLFDSLTQKEKKECFKLYVLKENSFKLYLFGARA